MGPLLYLSARTKYTLSVGLRIYMSSHELGWQIMMAAATLAVLPMIILYFIAQRYIVQGIVTSGLTGA